MVESLCTILRPPQPPTAGIHNSSNPTKSETRCRHGRRMGPDLWPHVVRPSTQKVWHIRASKRQLRVDCNLTLQVCVAATQGEATPLPAPPTRVACDSRGWADANGGDSTTGVLRIVVVGGDDPAGGNRCKAESAGEVAPYAVRTRRVSVGMPPQPRCICRLLPPIWVEAECSSGIGWVGYPRVVDFLSSNVRLACSTARRLSAAQTHTPQKAPPSVRPSGVNSYSTRGGTSA